MAHNARGSPKRLDDEQCQQVMDMVAAHGGCSAAARAMGLGRTTVQGRHDRAVARGFEPKVQALLAGDKAAASEGHALKSILRRLNVLLHMTQ